MIYRYHAFFSLFFLLLCTACTPNKSELAPAAANTYFPISIDETPLRLQLALSQSEQQQGLMQRDAMDKNNGMLFLFPSAGPRSFWMRNTRIPLDLAYFDDSGQLLEIHPLYPYDETSVPSRSQRVLIVVETNRGWFAQNNIRPGAQLNLGALAEAIKRRGKSPSAYPLQPTP
jgi:uncharacterized membrane protein (UPF0127 family)